MRQLMVREGRGAKDPITVLTQEATPVLQAHLEQVYLVHTETCAKASGRCLHGVSTAYLW